ncbi:hypothetical protein O181_121655, partial [Austropuccinia psidii MF-1]|nr:hypothetical protein [Austropuccinia psidii MF-1]
ESKILKSNSTIVSIFSPGYNYPNLNLNDLSLKNLNSKNPWKFIMAINQAKRDSMVLDAITMEFNRRYPFRVYHLFPGFVHTNAAANRALPFPLPQLSSIFGPTLARTIGNTPSSYSDIPVFFAANPKAKEFDSYFYNERLQKIEIAQWAQDKNNCEKLFDKISSFFNP